MSIQIKNPIFALESFSCLHVNRRKKQHNFVHQTMVFRVINSIPLNERQVVCLLYV